MIIRLSPIRSDSTLCVLKTGEILTINGISFDFGRLPDGATLPSAAVGSDSVLDPVERINGQLVLVLMLPHAADASESARFPSDIINPADGVLVLPGQVAQDPGHAASGVVDWSQIITAAAKAQIEAEQHLAMIMAETADLRQVADQAIAPLQDAVDLDEATEAEIIKLKDWKRYRVALSRLPDQEGYPSTIDWPVLPT